MWGQVLGAVGSSVAGGLMNKFMGAGSTPQSDAGGGLMASDSATTGIDSVTNGKTAPSNPNPSFMESAVSGIKSVAGSAMDGLASSAPDAVKGLIESKFGKSASDKGKDARSYLDSAFPELNAWEKSGAGASNAGMVDAGFENQKQLTKMQLDNNLDIARMNNEKDLKVAGIQSSTAVNNTKEQVYAQNARLDSQIRETEARIRQIGENTSLSVKQQEKMISDTLLSYAQTTGQHLTNTQISAITQRTLAETKNIDARTSNEETATSPLGKVAKDAAHILRTTVDNGKSLIRDSPIGKSIRERSLIPDTPQSEGMRRLQEAYGKSHGIQSNLNRRP